MIVYIRDPKAGKYYRYAADRAFVQRYDNGALTSCGLTIGMDLLCVPEGATRVSREEYQHSGCQSTCILRGNRECRW